MKYNFLDGYWDKNLGDDLFLKMITDRYPNTEFVIRAPQDYSYIKNVRNMYKYTYKYNLISPVTKILFGRQLTFNQLLKRFSGNTILLGGSIFIEKPYSVEPEKVKSYYILGANFGPYYTEKFFNWHKEFFAGAKDVCFRDAYSEKLFSDLDNVRSETDIAFAYKNIPQCEQRKNAVFSVIDTEQREDIDTEKYEKTICDMTDIFISKGYTVTFMSFCSKEGDEKAVRRIYEKLSAESRKNTDMYFYKGDIDEALKVMAESEIIVGGRYHAVILGFVLGKKVYPFTYSDKLNTVLEDMNYQGECYDMRKLNFDIKESIEKVMEIPVLDVTSLAKSAERQFRELDKIFK